MKRTGILIVFSFMYVLSHSQHFKPTFSSLQQYECPEWIQKAKFGINCHWNAQSASKSSNNGWYARQMYEEGSPAYIDHLKNWGHPSEVGYKDVVMAWEAPEFNAERLVSLFKDAGAKFVVTMAVHHDNFDFWNSKHQPKWNSLNYGPKKDVCKEMREAALKAGLKWGVTTHLERAYSWVQSNKGADKTGDKVGISYDGNMKEYQDLYVEYPNFRNLGPVFYHYRSPLASPDSWKKHWKARLFDLIDNYHPDFFYFDGALPYTDDGGKVGMEVLAHYYNDNAKMHKGKNEGFMGLKDIKYHGDFFPGVTSTVLERSYTDKIETVPKLSEESIGPWFHFENAKYYSSRRIISTLADVVSKNCIFMLNIPPKGDGSIDEKAMILLKEIGNWMKVNGDAIYETKPWKTFGEDNIRYTTKDNVLNVIICSDLKNNILLSSLKGWKKDDILSINLLGYNERINFNDSNLGILLNLPQDIKKGSPAYVFQINCKKLNEQPYTVVNQESVKKMNEEAAKMFGATGNKGGFIPLP